jgi:hypothetical protein
VSSLASIARITALSSVEKVTGVVESSGIVWPIQRGILALVWPDERHSAARSAGDTEIETDRRRIPDRTGHAKPLSTPGAHRWALPGAEDRADLTPLLGREHDGDAGIVLHDLSVARSYRQATGRYGSWLEETGHTGDREAGLLSYWTPGLGPAFTTASNSTFAPLDGGGGNARSRRSLVSR